MIRNRVKKIIKKNGESRAISFKKTRNLKKLQVICSILLAIIVIAELPQMIVATDCVIDYFTVEDNEVDCFETVVFHWDVYNDNNHSGRIKFGDGQSIFINYLNSTATHEYQTEGLYNVTLFIWWQDGSKVKSIHESVFITVINNAPQFDILLSSSAEEDELVNVSISNLIESDHDKEFGVLTYLFDFADTNTTSTNNSWVMHSWTNAGKYPVTVTVIDDQGALTQKNATITIINKSPSACFSIGGDIPGTYTFSEDIVGEIPLGWRGSNEDLTKHTIQTFGSQNGLGKVIRIKGNESKQYIDTYIEEQTHGTIEYLFYTSDNSKSTGYVAFRCGNNVAFSIFPQSENLIIKTADGSITILDCNEDDWNHVRVDFNMDNSDYLGLTKGQAQLYLNGEMATGILTFNANYYSYINYLEIGTNSSTLGVTAYIDAIGFSWDNNYEIGENYDYVWKQFRATHDFSNFLIGEVPDDDTWLITDNTDPTQTGIYNAVHGFQNDENEQIPTGWETWTAGESTVTVENDKAGHSKVVDLYDHDAVTSAKLYKTIAQSEGTIEFWIYFTRNDVRHWILLMDGGYGDSVYLFADCDGFFKYFYGSTGITYQANQWYNIKIEFDCEDDWHLWINGISADGGVGYAFRGNPTEIDTFQIETGYQWAYHHVYIDAVGYSWASNYTIGGNWYGTEDIRIEYDDKYFQEVARLLDNEDDKSICMKTYFTAQEHGTVEYWTKVSDITDILNYMSLNSNDTLALGVYINSSHWEFQRTINEFNDLSGETTLETDEWYHVRIDFECGTSSYQLLSEDQFRIIISYYDNSILCNTTYSFSSSFSSISSIQFQSSQSGRGTSYFDSLGFSWDLDYFINTNLQPVISYPTKSNVLFSADLTVDTESDIDTLKYYWKIDGNTVGFGKRLTYNFMTAGLYNVCLIVIDDNGNMSSCDQRILIHNTYPKLNISADYLNMTINEGETLLLNTDTWDDIADWARLQYYYNFNLTGMMDYLNTSSYENAGWKATDNVFR